MDPSDTCDRVPGRVTRETIRGILPANGGLLTVKDFADYHARWQDPLHITYRDYDVYSQPPGGSGMTCFRR